jgi:hypothetical protein
MYFNKLIQSIIEEKTEPEKEESEYSPWCIEIVKDPKRGEMYNLLGDLIIKLFELRSKLK